MSNDLPSGLPTRVTFLDAARRALLCVLGVTVLGALGACEDAATDPLEGLVAAETDVAALALGLPLPTPDHDALDGTDAEAGAAVLDWRNSWALPVRSGRDVRESAYPVLASALDRVMDRDDVQEEVELLEAGVRAARALPEDRLPVSVRDGIQRAAGSRAAAAAAFDARDFRAALEHVIRGGDALREVGPEAVARTVVGEAEALLRRISDDDSYSDRDRERISRLVRGSQMAMDEGEWVLAIRRAYYARGLVHDEG